MFYYCIEFNATEELAEVFGTIDINDYGYDDVILSQTFYVKSENKIETKEQMKNYLLDNFKPSKEFSFDLVNCIEPTTANEIYDFCEINDAEFESCCGIPA